MPDVLAFDPTVAPRWDWLAVGYFFLGGLAGGSFFLGALLDLFGVPADRPLVRIAYRVPVPCILIGALFLVVDLTHPERFWHMLWNAHEGSPMFKGWSPMSVGAWALGLFGAVAALVHLTTWSEEGRLSWRWVAWLRTGWRRLLLVGVGGVLAFFLAAYTGVLLSVTNRPGWSDGPLLGLLFLLSAASSAAAFLVLRGRARGRAAPVTIDWLARMDALLLVLELATLVALVVTIGLGVAYTRGGWGWLLLAVAVGGILVPLAFRFRAGARFDAVSAVLVLAGAFLLRTVVVFSVETL
jgi:formate-dependent nitrite reductase membrane component NrfD